MDSNNLPSNNYPPNAEANNNNQSNDYQNNWNPTDTYPNNANQTGSYQNNEYQNNTYQNDGYQNNGYQNGYQNNSYVNNDYQNNWNSTDTYQNNDYQNGEYQNNGYQNDWYQNDYQNGYQNGYQNEYANSYINNDKLLKTYKNFKQQAVNFMNTTLPADPTKRAYAIIAIVLAVIIFGCISINAVAHYHNCSSEKMENIEEYFDCNPSISKTSDNDTFSTTFEPDGARLNITSKFKDHLSEYDIRRVEAGLGERLLLMEMLPFSNDVANKVKETIRLHYTFLNDDGSVFYTDDFCYE
ncbi:hypothetical protein GK677_01330 [Bifidobacteriaceae bacterium NR044]|nr:hypothetical protein [Bifidobacteriaceae bacterium NR043]MBF9353418.1 hypothetical protein [Bifidobacteriaceae bacterium NR044]